MKVEVATPDDTLHCTTDPSLRHEPLTPDTPAACHSKKQKTPNKANPKI